MTLIAEEDPTRPIPKSTRHWAQKAGIYLCSRRYAKDWRRMRYFYASSRRTAYIQDCADDRRFFRVLPHINRMDICDGYFDRWANSLGASVPMPTTEAEFMAAVQTLLKKSRKRALEIKAAQAPEPQVDQCERCGATLPENECSDCTFDGLADGA
ncbi:hypothetical protein PAPPERLAPAPP_03790 [Brevundimonas phage vB_BpoS-Papperlapapp]|uniref:Uncharacterized protein n=1 Tax=Brevundimonas phage vB_BpoS-Domovoi TaxID=2948598 RepID=A0A9E7MQF8_9CAUD|nr:hypothetical protein DOMOVOI_02740 [Brevundimonas phage vB_BpoS-Domovoi]USN16120.1 hypothetical protein PAPPERLAPAPP_03790 [Brevundimonas phage vB_BpoS-Papperlapapp]